MNKLATLPTVDHTFDVGMTMDYSIFSFLKGNRVVNQLNLKRITDSMRERPLFSPITVNENFEIIDGQHRFLAQKELGLPIHYIVINGYGLDEVHILNANSTNWTRMDYLRGYAEIGLRPYVQFKQLMDEFPTIGMKAMLMIASFTCGDNHSMLSRHQKVFQEGKLLPINMAYSREVLQQLMDFSPFYPNYFRATFVSGLIILLRNKNYNHKEMISKLAMRPNQIGDETCGINYVLALEAVYNYMRREKVSLRY